MTIKVVDGPRVSLISRQIFYAPDHLGWRPKGFDTTAPEQIIEFAGRLCYMSFGQGEVDGHKTVQGRSSSVDYLHNLKVQAHGSVMEHGVIGLLFEGISRSLSHELVRHRAGFAYSQLSQRYVDESDVAFVRPPLIEYDAPEYTEWHSAMTDALQSYEVLIEMLTERGMSKKDACGTARSVLPNSTETKIVVTGNIRSWRNWLEQRGALAAEAEIRRLAIDTLITLQAEAPNLFSDYQVYTTDDGRRYIDTEFRKV